MIFTWNLEIFGFKLKIFVSQFHFFSANFWTVKFILKFSLQNFSVPYFDNVILISWPSTKVFEVKKISILSWKLNFEYFKGWIFWISSSRYFNNPDSLVLLLKCSSHHLLGPLKWTSTWQASPPYRIFLSSCIKRLINNQ